MAELHELGMGFTTVNATITTTAETLAIASDPVTVPFETCVCVIWAFAQVTTGASTTGLKPGIRRGADATGTLVGEANTVTLAAAAGGTEQLVTMVQEDRSNVATVQYAFTITPVAASADATILMAAIRVMVLT